MRFKLYLFILFLLSAFSLVAHAEEPAASQLQASNQMNPNISVIGWFQGEAGHRVLAAGEEDVPAFDLKEAEVAFQAIVDPYSRADVILSVTPDDAEIEEGTLTWFHLPGNFGLKVGKFKANMGKFNRTHTAETAFADRPLIHEALFGEEGLSGTGGSVSWNIPNPLFFMSLDGEAFTTQEADGTQAFEKAGKKNLTYVAHLNNFFDLGESANVTVGLSGAFGPAGEFLDVSNSSHTIHSEVTAADVTFRWKNPRRAVYRSAMWQTEVFHTRRDITDITEQTSVGAFSHLEYQFARRWRTGGRWDYAPSPIDKHAVEKGGLAYITFYPSEFSLVSIQARRVRKANGEDETLGWLKVTFNIGPHGAHPF